MGRELEFQPSEAVQKAMLVFWQKGYEKTSFSDLESATEVGRKSLSRVFCDKETLFIEALTAYISLMAKENLAPLHAPEANLTTIKAFLEKLLHFSQTEDGHNGCLICNTAVELGRDSPEIAKYVDLFFDQIRSAMRHALMGAKAKGQIDLSPKELRQEANFLLGVIQSLCVLARAGTPKQVLEDVVSSALKRLG